MRPILNCTLCLLANEFFFQLRGNVGEFRGTDDNPAERVLDQLQSPNSKSVSDTNRELQ